MKKTTFLIFASFFATSSLQADLLVDPFDTNNVNYYIFEDDDDHDDDNRPINSGDATSINGSPLPPPTLPAGLFLYGEDQAGDTWYVSTNGGFFPNSNNDYGDPITSNPGMYVFTDDLEMFEDSGDYIISSQNSDYYAITWRVHTYEQENLPQQNFQVIWIINDTTINGASFQAKDIVYVYGDMNGILADSPGVGVTDTGADPAYVTIPGASTESGSEGQIDSFNVLPRIAIFRWIPNTSSGGSYQYISPAMTSSAEKNKVLYMTNFYATLNWEKLTPFTRPDSYNVYRDNILIENVNGCTTQYTDNNLNPSQTYSYKVVSVNNGEDGSEIGQATIKTLTK